MAGMPHFADCEFDGAFPLARLAFSDEHFPGSVELLAFNPLIPTDTFDSSLPAAFFTILIRNDTQEAIEYTVAFSLRNFFTETGAGTSISGSGGPKGAVSLEHRRTGIPRTTAI